ncbi:DNA repair exonuclease [Indivirus ILV1]|uniref:DNA repair exonuclease n=1 Tax=Indivirus ILV1 TaxID=1977633 RepID=A0A1V0SE15_9VIRU|nr:DNA repair exonuclease [Indivirus ILV1]
MTTLKSSFNNDVKKIYHLADIHIRLNFDRHTEYREVFNRVYTEIKKEKDNTLIVLCGDILHSKNELSPECVDLAIEFIKNLSNITDLIMIMGNHDGNLSNKTKLDSLSPLIKEIKSKYKLHYLLNSGIYIYNNLVFGVSSVYDEQFISSQDINIKNKTKIALYHGVISSSLTDVGARLNSELTPESFDGYDYVLLGDVHRFQYMNPQKTICYPSSLIQQNYGESLNNHGLVLWDLEKKTSKFINIPNNYGYCCLNVKNGILIKPSFTIPKNPRIKLIIEETDGITLSEIGKTLKKQYNLQELTYSFTNSNFTTKRGKTKDQDTKNKQINDEKEIHHNLQDVVYQNQLIKDYTTKHMKLTKDELDGIIKINEELNKEIELKKVITNKWKIISLDFSNMFCYGQNNEIDFRKLEGIIGLFAPNHSGKSSIVDIILFTLFDKCSRGLRTDILNQKKTNFHCRITFEVDGNEYVIMRIGKFPKKNAKAIKIDVHFWKKNPNAKDNEDEYILLNGIDRNDTNKAITDLIGTYEDYIMTSFSLQKEINFIDYPQSKKKEFLMKILKLNIYDELLDAAKVTHKAKAFKLKELTDKTKDIDIYELRNKLSVDENKRIEICDSIEKINTLVDKYHNKIEYCNKKFINIKSTNTVNIDDIHKNIKKNNEEINLAEKQINIIEINYKKYIAELQKYQEEFNKFNSQKIEADYVFFKENKISKEKELNNKLKSLYESKKPIREFKLSYDEYIDNQQKFQSKINLLIIKATTLENSIIDISNFDQITSLYGEYNNIKSTMAENNKQLESLNKEINQMNSKLEKLKKHEYDPNCKFCMNNIFVKDAIETNEYLKSKSIEYTDIKTKIDKLSKQLSLKKYKDIELKYDKLEESKENNNNKQSQIKELNHQIALLKKESESINKIIEEYNSELENIEYNKRLHSDIKITEEEIDKIKNIVSEEYSNYKIVKNKIIELDTLSKEKKEKISKFETKIIQLKNKNEELNSIINNMKEYIEAEKNNEMIKNEINEVKNKIIKSQNEIKKYTLNKDSLLENICFLKKEIELYENHSEEIKQLEKETILYKNYTKLVNKDGLPYALLNNLIPMLQNETNNILLPLTNFSITIEQEKDSINIYKINEKNKLNIELCSGFEKFVVGMAMRIALISLSKLSSCNFMLIDEGFSCMDNTNINNLSSLFNTLKDMFDFIIVISHLDSVKSQCDEYMSIDKNNDGTSKINYE